jgi:hypothetical protein
MSDRVFLSKEQAIAMLPECDRIGIATNGATTHYEDSCDRQYLVGLINAEETMCELSGPKATSKGYGMFVNAGKQEWFVQTKE